MIPFPILATVLVTLVYGLPLVGLVALASVLPWPGALALALAAPILYTGGFVLVAGLVSRPFQGAIVPGRFPRRLDHRVYRARRIYGLAWTCVYYNKPLYFIALSVPWLKWMTFRVFGYRGSMDFTVYPDTWIRDLPLLDFGAGSYVANRATIGTNMALTDGTSLVDRVTIGRGAMVGHLAVLAPGVALGEEAEIGVGALVGIATKLGRGVLVQPGALLHHAARLESNAVVGVGAYVGVRSVVRTEAKLPCLGSVPSRGTYPADEDRERAAG